jgi:tol-pal system protein YbgF
MGFVLALAASGLGAGCASLSGARPATGAAAAESERTITELRAKNAGYARRVDELENRLIIVEDQLAARRAAEASHGAPKPPVRIVAAREDSVDAMSAVLARGKAAPTPAHSSAEARAENGGSSVVSDEDVEYGGEALGVGRRAARRGGHRPILRLHGGGRRAAAEELAASAEPNDGAGTKASRMYKRALTALRAGHTKKALAGFRRFLARHPKHDLADDAQFWLAECHSEQHDLPGAEAEYRRMIETYPNGSKVPDAMLKLGRTLAVEGEAASSRQVYESLARAFPNHEAGRAAAEQLAAREEPARTGRAQPKILGTIVPPAVAATGEAARP